LIGGFSRDAAGDDIQDNTLNGSGDEIGAGSMGNNRSGGDDNGQSRSTGRSIMAAFGRRPSDDEGRESIFDETISTTITVSSGSVFMPSR
jgi:hypothetical protein